MGYILPAAHDQYLQYAEREAGNRGHSIQFKPIAKINREGTGLIPYQALSADNRVLTEREIAVGKKLVPGRKTIEKVYAEVTGKGKYFSERI
jgi:hypothetical protein